MNDTAQETQIAITNFKMFFDDEMIGHIAYYTGLYSAQTSIEKGSIGRGVAMVHPLPVMNQTRSSSFSFKHQEYCFFVGEITRTRNFAIFAVYASSFGQFTAALHFFNVIGK